MIPLAQKDILRLQVSVKNFAIVHVLHRESDLREPSEYLVLREKVHDTRGLVLVLFILDTLGEVSTLAELHDDTEDTLARAVDFSEARDKRMVQNLEDARLSERRLLLFFVHLGDLDLLDDSIGAIAAALNEVCLAVGALTDRLNALVLLGRFGFLA